MLSNQRIHDSFCEINDLWSVIYKFEEDIKQHSDNILVGSEDVKQTGKLISALKNSYKQKIFVKLNFIFRRQMILTEQEATNFYNDEDYLEFIQDRITALFDVIDYINNDMGVLYIPDKMTICAYFRISADLWSSFIGYGNLNETVRNMFIALEEFIISATTTGVENGFLNSIAWKKLELKGKYGGNDVSYSTSNVGNQRQVVDPVIEKQKELEHKLKNKYDFIIDVSADDSAEKK